MGLDGLIRTGDGVPELYFAKSSKHYSVGPFWTELELVWRAGRQGDGLSVAQCDAVRCGAVRCGMVWYGMAYWAVARSWAGGGRAEQDGFAAGVVCMQCRAGQSRWWSKRKHGDRCNVESLELAVEEGVSAWRERLRVLVLVLVLVLVSTQEADMQVVPSDVGGRRVAVGCVTGRKPSRDVEGPERPEMTRRGPETEGWVSMGRRKGEGRFGLGLIRMNWIIEDVQRQREARRKEQRQREAEAGADGEAAGKNLSIAAVCTAASSIYLGNQCGFGHYFFCLPFVDPQLQSVSSAMYG